jgi:hypothetical protein
MAVVSRKDTPMDIEICMEQTAKHEAYHMGVALHSGLEVERATLLPHSTTAYGETVLIWPWQPKNLWLAYRQNPLATLPLLRACIATLAAPHFLRDEPLLGADKHCLEMWERRWNVARRFSTPHGPDFATLTAQARKDVLTWFETPGRKEQTAAFVAALLRHGSLDAPCIYQIAAKHRVHRWRRPPSTL